MRKFLLTAALIFAIPMLATAQDSHAGHNHSADDGHNHGSTMSDAEKAKIDYIYSIAPDDHVMGNTSAPNTMIVYASVTCSHCSDWFIEDFPTIKKDLIDTGKLKMVFREFVTGPQEVSVAGFQLALCAPEDKYFDVIRFQMDNQKETFAALQEGKAIERFLEIAKIADITDQDAMFTCFDNEDGFDRLQRSIDRARAGDIKGVPGVIFNGELIKGKVGASEIKALTQ